MGTFRDHQQAFTLLIKIHTTLIDSVEKTQKNFCLNFSFFNGFTQTPSRPSAGYRELG